MGVHRKNNETIIGICDSELIGKTFVENDTIIDLDKYAKFYGEKSNEEEVKKRIVDATVVNLVGEGAVLLAERIGLISKKDLKNVKKIQGVSHLQIIKVK